MPRLEPWHVISNNVVCATSKASDQPAHTRSLIRAFASHLNILLSVQLLTEHNLEYNVRFHGSLIKSAIMGPADIGALVYIKLGTTSSYSGQVVC